MASTQPERLNELALALNLARLPLSSTITRSDLVARTTHLRCHRREEDY